MEDKYLIEHEICRLENEISFWEAKISLKDFRERSTACEINYENAFERQQVLADNRCVVTKFEKDNPIEGAPEVFVKNPLTTNNNESFWNTTLDMQIISIPNTAKILVDKIKELYIYFNRTYTKGQYITNVGLKEEPYFKYFEYHDFLTPNSGLIQIKKFAENNSNQDLLDYFSEISLLKTMVRDELKRILITESKYFE